MSQPEEIDRDNQLRIADSRRHTGNVEEGVDGSGDGRHGLVDRGRAGQIDFTKVVEVECWSALIQAQYLGTQLAELVHEVCSDARRTSGHHGAASVVAPQ